MAKQLPIFSERVWRIIGAGMIAFVLVGVIGIHFSGVSAGRLERQLLDHADDALAGREHAWAHVRMDGQRAILESAALRSTWSGGEVAGGVTRVIDLTTRTDFEAVFAFRATASNGRITILGDAASERAVRSITDYARQLFPAGQEVALTVTEDGSAPANDWETAAKRIIAELARLERGTGVLTDHEIGLYGHAGSDQTARSVLNMSSDLPAGFTASAYLVDRNGRTHDGIISVAGCDAVVRAARADESIRFTPGQAGLTAGSREAVRRIGEILTGCPPARVTVSVRVTGDPGEAAIALTEARAQEAMDTLAEAGLSPDRLAWNASETQAEIIRFVIVPAEGE
jgi:outer membrane protein OmpA-like peptidoglycan-associated protein